MMLRYSLGNSPGLADRIETAVGRVLDDGLRTPGHRDRRAPRSWVTSEMGDAVVAALSVAGCRRSLVTAGFVSARGISNS